MLNVFCAVSKNMMLEPFSFAETTITGFAYVDTLERHFIAEDSSDTPFQ
jgi:hypothetical protein